MSPLFLLHDPAHYQFERRSGLPLGYFDGARRRRRRLGLVAVLLLELLVGVAVVAFTRYA